MGVAGRPVEATLETGSHEGRKMQKKKKKKALIMAPDRNCLNMLYDVIILPVDVTTQPYDVMK